MVTTFNQEGLNLYAQKFINSFENHVDKQIKLKCFTENCTPIITNTEQIEVLDIKKSLPKLRKASHWL